MAQRDELFKAWSYRQTRPRCCMTCAMGGTGGEGETHCLLLAIKGCRKTEVDPLGLCEEHIYEPSMVDT